MVSFRTLVLNQSKTLGIFSRKLFYAYLLVSPFHLTALYFNLFAFQNTHVHGRKKQLSNHDLTVTTK